MKTLIFLTILLTSTNALARINYCADNKYWRACHNAYSRDCNFCYDITDCCEDKENFNYFKDNNDK